MSAEQQTGAYDPMMTDNNAGIPLPTNFLEDDTDNNPSTYDHDVQQRIINGDLVPEPSEFATFSDFDQPTAIDQPFNPQYTYQQQEEVHTEEPWEYQPESTYQYAEYDPALEQQQYVYTGQPSSSAQVYDNPFEEEEYEPTPVTRPQLRFVGRPPMEPRRQVQVYNLEYHPQPVIRRPIAPSTDADNRVRRVVRRPATRRETMDDDMILGKHISEAVRAQAAQRISTPEGWQRLNFWLKKAYEANDREKLINLLETCQEAEISTELLRSNDTAKIVREISRKHPNATINRLSSDILKAWKATAIAESKAAKQQATKPQPAPVDKPKDKDEPKEKEPAKEEQASASSKPNYTAADENLLDKLTEAMDNNVLNRQETKKSEETAKRPRTKAKVKLSGVRRTGLEGDDDAPPAAPSKKKPEPPKKKQTPVLANVTAPPAEPQKVPPAKRGLEQSDIFMAAFEDVEKRPAKKKLKANKLVKVVQPDVPEKNSPTPPTVQVKSEWEIKDEVAVLPKPTESIDQLPKIPRTGGGILRRRRGIRDAEGGRPWRRVP